MYELSYPGQAFKVVYYLAVLLLKNKVKEPLRTDTL